MPARCEQTRGLCLGRKSIADKVLPAHQALIAAWHRHRKGQEWGGEGLPLPEAAGSPCNVAEPTLGPLGPFSGLSSSLVWGCRSLL